MKKVLLSMLAVAGLFAATSCSQEADLNRDAGKSGKFTFNVNVDDVLGTRAMGKGTQATELKYQIFNDDNSELLKSGTTTVTDLKATVEVELVSGETYNAVFWAQSPGCQAYTLNENGTITVNKDNLLNNDESLDAFFGSVSVTPSEDNMDKTVELKRPFAQLNVGVLVDNFRDLGIENSSMTITGCYTTLDLLTGDVDDAQELEFKTNAVPSTDEYFTVTPSEGEAQNYNYISTTYVLVGTDRETNYNVSFAFGGTQDYTLDYENVPLQRNYRTNITTEQEMEKFAFNIQVVPAWGGDDIDKEGELKEGEENEQPEQQTVTVSDIKAEYLNGDVVLGATLSSEVAEANFVCTPVARAAGGTITVPAKVMGTTLSATVDATEYEFVAGLKYDVTVVVPGYTVETSGEDTTTPSLDIPEATEQPGQPVTVTYTCSSLGSETLSTISSIEIGDVTFTFSKGQGQTAPSYNKAGDIRLYAKNVITVSGKNCTITEMKFNLDNTQLSNVTPSEGTISGLTTGATTVTWNGDSSNFTLTVGEKADFGSDTSKAGQFRFKSVTVTYIPD